MPVSRYSDGSYLENNPTWHAEDAPFKADWIATILKRNNLSPASIIEVGCGSGQVLNGLQSHFPEATCQGYDLSPQAIQLAQQHAQAKLTFSMDDPLGNGAHQCELAMAIDVFEHVPDYMSFIRKMTMISDYQIFHIPLDLSVQALLRGNVLHRVRLKLGHLHYFAKESALDTLADCECEIIDWMYTSNSKLPNRSLRKRLLGVPREALFKLAPDLSARVLGGFSILALTSASEVQA